MFDDNNQTLNTSIVAAPTEPASAPVVDPATVPSPAVDPSVPTAPTADSNSYSVGALPADPVAGPAPVVDPTVATPVEAPVEAPAPIEETSVASTVEPAIGFGGPIADTPSPAAGGADLLGIKQDALQSLTPLLSHLDQTPEEKFRTTMMLIQASDDQSLVQTAYAAAKEISDEKIRAQAILDIVNEINYFTQQKPAA